MLYVETTNKKKGETESMRRREYLVERGSEIGWMQSQKKQDYFVFSKIQSALQNSLDCATTHKSWLPFDRSSNHY